MSMYSIVKTTEFNDWLLRQTLKAQGQIEERLKKIKDHGHFGDVKDLGNGIFELRWKNGRRVYFAKIEVKSIFILLGGNKNGQDKDIKKAKAFLS